MASEVWRDAGTALADERSAQPRNPAAHSSPPPLHVIVTPSYKTACILIDF